MGVAYWFSRIIIVIILALSTFLVMSLSRYLHAEKPISIPSSCRAMLTQAGPKWLMHVLDNIQEVQYVDFYALYHEQTKQDAIGLSWYDRGKRKAVIAVKNHTDLEICSSLVHEAEHLRGYTVTGLYSASEKDAELAEYDFLVDYSKAYAGLNK